jgi:hypothetical protein
VANISVRPGSDGTFLVDLTTDEARTNHVVSVPAALPISLGLKDVPEDELVRASFAFLLEREPPSSILRRFSLDVIGTYFPEYPNEIGRMVTKPAPEEGKESEQGR